MENLISELCEILEVSELPIQSPFSSMEEWDSLNALAVLSMLDSYGLTMEAEALEQFESISQFLEYVIDNKK